MSRASTESSWMGLRITWLPFALSATAALAGCASNVGGTGHGDGGDAANRDVARLDVTDPDARRDGGGGGNGDGNSSNADVPEESCGSTAVPIQGVPPNVLIVFDRSGSMRQTISGSEAYWDREGDGWAAAPRTPPTNDPIRWTIARTAIERIIARYGSRIRWGIEFFPAPGGTRLEGDAPPTCDDGGVTGPQVLPGGPDGRTDSGPLVLAELAKRRTTTWDNRGSGTPTVRALEVAALPTSGLRDATRGNFVLLMTDGAASCQASTDTQRAATQALRNLPTNVRTAAVGISNIVGTDGLTAIANAGGLARSGSPPFYVANSLDDLNAAFDAIAAQSLSCTLRLQSTPPDPTRIYVAVDGAVLTRDAANGYRYDTASNSVTLTGTRCDDLRAGRVRQLTVSYGCRPIVTCTPNNNTEWCDGIDNDCDGTIDDQCIRIPG